MRSSTIDMLKCAWIFEEEKSWFCQIFIKQNALGGLLSCTCFLDSCGIFFYIILVVSSCSYWCDEITALGKDLFHILWLQQPVWGLYWEAGMHVRGGLQRVKGAPSSIHVQCTSICHQTTWIHSLFLQHWGETCKRQTTTCERGPIQHPCTSQGPLASMATIPSYHLWCHQTTWLHSLFIQHWREGMQYNHNA